MARIAFEVSPAQLRKAQSLIESNAYDSIQQLAEIAFANQLALEAGADPQELAERSRPAKPASKPTKSKRSSRIPPLKPREQSASKAVALEPTKPEPLPTFESVIGRLRLTAAPTPPPVAVTVAADQRVLALVNKPFGLKLVSRAVLATAQGTWPAAEEVAAIVGRDAGVVASELRNEDRGAERTRNLLNTGLPDAEDEQSVARFSVQYLARLGRSGQATAGAIVHFGLAALLDGRVALSPAGVAFARLANPVLDSTARPWTALLSREEQRFLLEHIKAAVPLEAADSLAVLRAVRAGNDRPESLLGACKDALPPAWTELQLRSYLSGLVTRLSELDVLERVWSGRTVRYALAANAHVVLGGMDAAEVAQ